MGFKKGFVTSLTGFLGNLAALIAAAVFSSFLSVFFYQLFVRQLDVYKRQPYLMQIGFLSRTPRGRCATRAAYLHLGLTPPGENIAQQSLFKGEENG